MHKKRINLVKTITLLLKKFPVVALIGARQVGKTTLSKMALPNAKYFDLEKESDYERINSSAELIFLEEKGPFFFDEAQLMPKLFKALRVEVDREREKNGRFLISGSSSPELLKEITETLAGRVAIVEIGTLNWSEINDSTDSNFYKAIEIKNIDKILTLESKNSHSEIVNMCLKGTYPEAYLKSTDNIFFEQWMENYIKSYIDRDIRRLFPQLNLEAFRRFIRMTS